MNILVISNLYPPNAVGGYERLCALVVSTLARRGHKVAVLTSDYNSGERQGREDLSIERSLRLLISNGKIYQPFSGSAAEREAINRHNLSRLAQKIESERPEAILVGNLYFLDPSFLSGLRSIASRVVYLLTDIWMINFVDGDYLQEHFRCHVFGVASGTPALVPADPPDLVPDRIESSGAWTAYAMNMTLELLRRRRLERELSAGRAVYQTVGQCHLCGVTSFRVRRAGPDTLALSAQRRTEAVCARCGLDGTTRGALHLLDTIAGPKEDEGVLVAISDERARQFLQERYPRFTVSSSVADPCGNGRPSNWRYRHMVCLNATAGADGLKRMMSEMAARLDRGGLLVFGGPFVSTGESAGDVPFASSIDDSAKSSSDENPPGPGPGWAVLKLARDSGLVDAAAYLFWSDRYGYIGRDHLLYAARADS